MVARVVALYNIVRYAMYVRSVFEQAKMGEDVDGSAMYMLNKLMIVDPATGLAFDRSAFAQMLFNGGLTSEPSGVSAIGGALLATMYTGMHTFHQAAGDFRLPQSVRHRPGERQVRHERGRLQPL